MKGSGITGLLVVALAKHTVLRSNTIKEQVTMRKLIKLVVIVLVVLILLPIIALSFVVFTKPSVASAPVLTITSTPEMLERGRYLFNHQAACAACHTPRSTEFYSYPIIAGKEGAGGEKFGREEGVPGVIYAANITPAKLKDWSDGEIYRTLTTGVTKDGEALFPLMPYTHYAAMSEPDLHAIIAYMRTLPAIENEVPKRSLSFPMNIIVRLIPKEASPPAATPAVTDAKYGEYVTNAGACLHCHTKSNHGKIKPGSEFSGGVEFTLPDGSKVRSANITPDTTTGIGSWTKEQFINRFRTSIEMAKQPAKAGELNSLMPWTSYAGMNDADLGAIYDYLKTLPPVSNAVEKFTPITSK